MSHFKMQPDNLTNKEKKLTYLLIIVLLIISVVFFGIIRRISNYESDIRNGKDYINIKCEIVGYRAKAHSSVFKYEHKGIEYEFSQHNTDKLKIGEKYRGRLNKYQPEVAIMLLNEPVIDTTEYKSSIARIIEIESKKGDLSLVTYSYEIKNQKFTRAEYVSSFFKLKIGENISVLYKIDDPKISYIDRKIGGNPH
ncbi:MAG: hypothetical protein JEZ01_18435 [Labilibaculum sp.]|nr:hypothetical protein [Labilibaculum sp.]MBI9059748.1 hypothetical protein [Labilibaculum sp.]